MKIKYNPLSVLLVTVVLIYMTIILFSAISNLSGNIFVSILMYSLFLLFTLSLLNWFELFLFPFIIGRPALILKSDGLYVDSIGQLIPWDDIQKTSIKYTRNNHIVRIYVKEPAKTTIETKSISRRFWCRLSIIEFNTPFSFSTLFIRGSAAFIYDSIKSRIK